MNLTRFKTIIDRIKANPACHNQNSWHCGTAHCLAGHAQIDAGKEPDDKTVRKDARLWLELSDIRDADWLFASHRTRTDFDKVISSGVIPQTCRRKTYGYELQGRFTTIRINPFKHNGRDTWGRDADGLKLEDFTV